MAVIGNIEYISESLKFTAIFFAFFEMLPLNKREYIEVVANKYFRDFNYSFVLITLLIVSISVWVLGNDGTYLFKMVRGVIMILIIVSLILMFFMAKKTEGHVDKIMLSIIATLFIVGLLTPRALLEYLAVPYNSFLEIGIFSSLPLNKIDISGLFDTFEVMVTTDASLENPDAWYIESQKFIELQIFYASVLILLLMLIIGILILVFWSVISIAILPFSVGLRLAHKLKSAFSLKEQQGIPIFGFLLWASGEALGFSVKTYIYFS